MQTAGNPDGLVILRGSGRGPNYDAASIGESEAMMAGGRAGAGDRGWNRSHANSGSDHARQEIVWDSVLAEHRAHSSLVGMMIESHLHEGKQPIPADLSQLKYGVSITDACLGWETTERICWSAPTARWGRPALPKTRRRGDQRHEGQNSINFWPSCWNECRVPTCLSAAGTRPVVPRSRAGRAAGRG